MEKWCGLWRAGQGLDFILGVKISYWKGLIYIFKSWFWLLYGEWIVEAVAEAMEAWTRVVLGGWKEVFVWAWDVLRVGGR